MIIGQANSPFNSSGVVGSVTPENGKDFSISRNLCFVSTSTETFSFESCGDNTDVILPNEDENGDVSVGDLLDALHSLRGPKRIRRPRRSVPRLLHSDTRRFYATMLANAFNSYDEQYLHAFLELYMTPLATSSQPALKSEVMTKPSILLVGINSILRFRSFYDAFVSDQTIRVENVRVVRYSNRETSKVVCDLEVAWTQIYDHHGVHSFISSAMRSNPNVEFREVSDGYEYRSTTCWSENSEAVEPPVCSFLPTLLPIQRRTRMVMPLTLHINELRQIFAMECGSASVA